MIIPFWVFDETGLPVYEHSWIDLQTIDQN